MVYAIFILIALAWGWIKRMSGGAPPKLPLGLDQWVFALPYLLCAFPVLIASAGAAKFSKGKIASIFVIYMAAVTGTRTGHGGGIDMGTSTKERKDEALEFIIKPLHGRISEYWYDALLLAVTGLAVTIPAGLGLAFINPLAGLSVAASGLWKAVAYMIGWMIYPEGQGRGLTHLNEATAIGEFLHGFLTIAHLLFVLEYFFQLSALIEAVL